MNGNFDEQIPIQFVCLVTKDQDPNIDIKKCSTMKDHILN